jgi:hypothetical protein
VANLSLCLAITFKEATQKAADIIKDRVLVGHAVYNDLKALMLDHPRALIRDTSRYKPFRKLAKGRTPGLKLLVKELLHIDIQAGSHSSVSPFIYHLLRLCGCHVHLTKPTVCRWKMQDSRCYCIKR